MDLPIDKIVEMYVNDGVSENVIGKYFGVSRGAIRSRLLKACVKIRGRSEAEKLKWSQRTPDQRLEQVRAAHEATKGRIATRQERIKHALNRQRECPMSPLETKFLKVFNEVGISVVPEYALDIYNLDFAIPLLKVAIEINGGNWHQSKPKRRYDTGKEVLLSNRGWRLIVIKVSRGKITVSTRGDTTDLIPLFKAIYSHPSLWCKNGVISSEPTST